MPVVISDEMLELMGLNENAARLEIACRLFDAQVIGKGMACKLCGLHRDDFDAALVQRDLPVLRYTQEMLKPDMEAIKRWESEDADRGQRHVNDPRAGASRSA